MKNKANMEHRSRSPIQEHLSFQIGEIRLEGENGIFEGYAATFGDIDSYGSRIMPGAFTKTLAERADKIKVLHNHDQDSPIGMPLEMREDNKGLWVRAQLTLGVQKADEAFLLMKSGAFDAMSIGFSVPRGKDKIVDGVREIFEVKLFEFSPVTFPANEQAQIQSVRATDLAGTVTEKDLDAGEERLMEALHRTMRDIWWSDNTVDDIESLLGAAVDDFAVAYKDWLKLYLDQFRTTPEAEAPEDGIEELHAPAIGVTGKALALHMRKLGETLNSMAMNSPLAVDDIRSLLKGNIEGRAERLSFVPGLAVTFSQERRSKVEMVAQELRASLSSAEREQFAALLGLQPSDDTVAKEAEARGEPQQALTELMENIRSTMNK